MTRTITSARIHPGIGIARVGNSTEEDGFYIGPEVPTPQHRSLRDPDYYRDSTGRLKREAARFRIYGYDEHGEVVRELDCHDEEVASITWRAHVANKKAAWYDFEVAMDIPQAVDMARRNANIIGSDRDRLVIDPGPKRIDGVPNAAPVQLDGGRFWGKPVNLGELRTDDAGRLLFLGGHGLSQSAFANNPAMTFGNNDGWHDDTSDGPIHATVTLKDGTVLEAEGAWVVVAPPNYAPDIISVVTMYDVLLDTYNGLWLTLPRTPSFTEHILPLFEQFVMAQWVNHGFLAQFGWSGPNDFLDPRFMAKLGYIDRSDPEHIADPYRELRRQIFHAFRPPGTQITDINAWPWMYGDGMAVANPPPDAFMTVTRTQYRYLQQWARGDFVADYRASTEPRPTRIEEVPLQAQPATLDKAAMWYCLGGPFHPGCEMTWPMRQVTMYSGAFRIRERAPDDPRPDYGDVLTPAVALGGNGPLYANGPGDITRWMAVPWQTDTASCRAGYDSKYDPTIPTFWPARVPNHVLREQDYEIARDTDKPEQERLNAFFRRATWYRFLGENAFDQLNNMIECFWELGVIEARPGPGEGDPLGMPAIMYVETLPAPSQEISAATQTRMATAAEVPVDRGRVTGAEHRAIRFPRSGRRGRAD